MLDLIWSVWVKGPEVDGGVSGDETLEAVEGVMFIAHGERIVGEGSSGRGLSMWKHAKIARNKSKI